MSLGIYPEFNPKLRGTKFEALGEVLARNYQALECVAVAAKIKPLTAFADAREVPNDFDGPPEILDDLLGPWTEWFDPVEGRTAFQALTKYIKENPIATRNLAEAGGVIDELEELARVLAVAEREGARFRLQMS